MKPIQRYVDTARGKGKTDEEITRALVAAGWEESQARAALTKEVEDLPPPPPPSAGDDFRQPMNGRRISSGAYAWYAFEHILMFISLAVLTVSIALILNHFVDRYFPAMAFERGYGESFRNSELRGYLAALIVSLPLFSFLFLDITKRTLAHPELRNLIVRKVLIYMTLVVTFVVMLGFIISAVYNLLGGNVTINFALHLLVTVATAGVVFTYYLFQVKEDRRQNA